MERANRFGRARIFNGIINSYSEICQPVVTYSTREVDCNGTPVECGDCTGAEPYPLSAQVGWACDYVEKIEDPVQLYCGALFPGGGSFTQYADSIAHKTQTESYTKIAQVFVFTKSGAPVDVLTNTAVYWPSGGTYVNSGISQVVKQKQQRFDPPAGGFPYRASTSGSVGSCQQCPVGTGGTLSKTNIVGYFTAQGVYTSGFGLSVNITAGTTGTWTLQVIGGAVVISKDGVVQNTFSLGAYTIGSLGAAIDALTSIVCPYTVLPVVIRNSSATEIKAQGPYVLQVAAGTTTLYIRKPGDPWESYQVAALPYYSFTNTNWGQYGGMRMDYGFQGNYTQFSQGISNRYDPDDAYWAGRDLPFYDYARGCAIAPTLQQVNNCTFLPTVTPNNCSTGCGGGSGTEQPWDLYPIDAVPASGNSLWKPYTGATIEAKKFDCGGCGISDAECCSGTSSSVKCSFTGRGLGFCSCYGPVAQYPCWATSQGLAQGLRWQLSVQRY